MDKNQINARASADINRNRDVLALVLSLVLSAGVFGFLVLPVRQQRMEAEKANAAKQADLESKQGLLSNIESFNKKNKNLGVNSTKLVAMIPNRNNFEDFFIHLRSLAKNNNLEVTDMSLKDVANASGTPTATEGAAIAAPTEGAAAEGTAADGGNAAATKLNEQGIELKLRGNYSDFLNFSKSLENGIAFLQEDSFSAKSAEKETSSAAPSGTPSATPVPTKQADPNPLLDFDLSLKFIYY